MIFDHRASPFGVAACGAASEPSSCGTLRTTSKPQNRGPCWADVKNSRGFAVSPVSQAPTVSLHPAVGIVYGSLRPTLATVGVDEQHQPSDGDDGSEVFGKGSHGSALLPRQPAGIDLCHGLGAAAGSQCRRARWRAMGRRPVFEWPALLRVLRASSGRGLAPAMHYPVRAVFGFAKAPKSHLLSIGAVIQLCERKPLKLLRPATSVLPGSSRKRPLRAPFGQG